VKASNGPPPIVLIPGAMSSALSWRYQIDAFKRDRQVIVPDQHYSLTSINLMARDIARRLPRRFDLVGWSMGGYVVFELYPLIHHRVRNLILISTNARPESKEAVARREALLSSIDVEGVNAVYAREFDYDLFNASRIDSAFKAAIVEDTVRFGKETLRNQFKAMMSRNDSRLSLKTIKCPALIIAGSNDPVIPAQCSEEIASLVPCATLYLVHECGHCPPWEKTEEVNALMQEFLR
jgi:pimeloyl-ACP methyl ester carboxylesterase